MQKTMNRGLLYLIHLLQEYAKRFPTTGIKSIKVSDRQKIDVCSHSTQKASSCNLDLASTPNFGW